MATLPPLADPAELSRWTGLPADDLGLLDALNSASTRFRSEVRHPVTLVENEEIWLDGTGTTILLLPAAPVTAVASVQVDGTPAGDVTWSRHGILERRRGWPDRLSAVRVVYSHGHQTIPAEIADAVILEARYLLALDPGVTALTVGGESVTYASASGEMPRVWTQAVANFNLNQGDRP